LLQRFHIQCHEWRYDDHGNFLDAAARSELQQLTEHVAQRLRLLTLDRARRGNLPWPNANFVGREPELASLRAALLDAPEQSPAGIHGVGGMGKTALAQAFAYKEADAFPGGCWLLRCEGRDPLLSVFRTLVTDLEIELTDEEKLDDAKAVRRVFDVLRVRGPALFLLDNVDRPALLAQEQMKLLADQPWARVLYTTRLAPDDFTKAGATIRPLDLDRLPENQAVDLIRRYQFRQAFASPEHEAAAREIVRELSGLTLAVETAAVYLGQCDPRVAEPQYAVDVRNYLNKLREDLKTGGSEGVMNQLREVTATLRPTLARLDAPARTVLQIASMLAPDGVALPWVRAIAGQSHPELAADAATGQSDPWTQLIRGLIGMRLFQPTAEPRVIAIHRILQRVLEAESVESISKQNRGESPSTKPATVLKYVSTRVEAIQSGWLEPSNRWEIEPLHHFCFVILEAGKQEASEFGDSVALVLYNIGEYGRGKELLRETINAAERLHGFYSADVSAILSTLIQLERETHNLIEARKLAVNALEIDESLFPPDHPRLAARCSDLGTVEQRMGNHQTARGLFQRCVSILANNKDTPPKNLAGALSNLAVTEDSCGNHQKARDLLRNALTIEERLYPEKHPKPRHSSRKRNHELFS
jgi:tetratricopeptide (TPR) repeat protein